MDECYIKEYEQSMIDVFSGGRGENVGYIGHIAGRRISDHTIDLSWYPNIYDRFHEVTISLPRDQFIACVGSWRYDEKPHIFVKSAWLEHLYLRQYSIFCMLDAIGVKDALRKGTLSRNKLIALRDAIDKESEEHQEASFISFADSLLLKSNWSVGYFKSDVSYTYQPEKLVNVISNIRNIYQNILGLDVYAILTQGSNEYYEDQLLHISKSNNHICLNSLGLPFAQLMAIDNSAYSAIRAGTHTPSEVYIDAQLLHSLRLKFQFNKKSFRKYSYHHKMMRSGGHYYCIEFKKLSDNIDSKTEDSL
jgi:hypothetical protein